MNSVERIVPSGRSTRMRPESHSRRRRHAPVALVPDRNADEETTEQAVGHRRHREFVGIRRRQVAAIGVVGDRRAVEWNRRIAAFAGDRQFVIVVGRMILTGGDSLNGRHIHARAVRDAIQERRCRHESIEGFDRTHGLQDDLDPFARCRRIDDLLHGCLGPWAIEQTQIAIRSGCRRRWLYR